MRVSAICRDLDSARRAIREFPCYLIMPKPDKVSLGQILRVCSTCWPANNPFWTWASARRNRTSDPSFRPGEIFRPGWDFATFHLSHQSSQEGIRRSGFADFAALLHYKSVDVVDLRPPSLEHVLS